MCNSLRSSTKFHISETRWSQTNYENYSIHSSCLPQYLLQLTSSRGISLVPHLLTHSKGIRLHTFMWIYYFPEIERKREKWRFLNNFSLCFYSLVPGSDCVQEDDEKAGERKAKPVREEDLLCFFLKCSAYFPQPFSQSSLPTEDWHCHRLVLELYISNAPQSVRVSNEKNSSILRFTS